MRQRSDMFGGSCNRTVFCISTSAVQVTYGHQLFFVKCFPSFVCRQGISINCVPENTSSLSTRCGLVLPSYYIQAHKRFYNTLISKSLDYRSGWHSRYARHCRAVLVSKFNWKYPDFMRPMWVLMEECSLLSHRQIPSASFRLDSAKRKCGHSSTDPCAGTIIIVNPNLHLINFPELTRSTEIPNG